jgi:ribonuclease HII
LPSLKISGKTSPDNRFEKEAFSLGATRIAGVDEAGRGPLAGPVVAAAVILARGKRIPGINDSKLLAAPEREELFRKIVQKAAAVGVGIVSHETIDEINILQATRLAMNRAVSQIDPAPDYLLIDGPIALDLKIRQKPLIKGDRLSVSVAAASIVAKVTRDGLMIDLHEEYPQYGFDRHKGYATEAHREAILLYGPCPVHRKCFRGVACAVQTDLFDCE